MQNNFDMIRSKASPKTNAGPARQEKKTVNNKTRKIIIVATGALLALGIVFVTFHYFTNRSGAFIDRDKYQAIFLSNNQVYFGKLQLLGDNSYRLTDVFYVQSQNTPGAATSEQTSEQASQAAQNASPTLVKLGSELHTPEDEIIFNSAQVTFWENLKSDGKVAKSISEYKNKR